MKLQTAYYLPESSCDMPDPMIGLPDLRKGLNTILMGYALSVGAVLLLGFVVGYLIVQLGGTSMSGKSMEQASTVMFAAVLLFGLAMIGSLILIVRGKWLCLSSAPEQHHAKWWMFMSILCILAGPALNLGASLVGDTKAASSSRGRNKTTSVFLHEIEKYEHGMPELDTRSYIRLAGQGAGLCSGIFFVLFLRAVALSWGARWRASFAELYLLFVALLAGGVGLLIWKPSLVLARPVLLLGLGGGWLLAGLWYFALILSTTIGISSILAMPRRKETGLDSSEQIQSRSEHHLFN